MTTTKELAEKLIELRSLATQGEAARLTYGVYVKTKSDIYDIKIADTSCEDNDLSHRECEANSELIFFTTNHAADICKEYLKSLEREAVMKAALEFYDGVHRLNWAIDFDDLPALGIKNLDVEKLYKEGKTKLGIVFNLDEHWKSGSHWTALYTDMKGGKIYYFDSYGSKPPERVRVLMRRLARFYQTGRGIRNPDADYNKMRHQYKNSECGVYSMNFILRMLRGTTLEEVNSIRISDEKINKCRRKYFR